jgi:shikimate kinase
MAIDPQKLFSIRTRLDRPISLVGMMGAGKTRLGKMLAETLNIPFVDSDEEIEKAAGLSIPEIFEKFGEPYFRDGERRVIKRLLDQDVQVIATGGGAILNPDTASELCTQTLEIWVKADLDVMLERTAKTDRRPLLKAGNPKEIMMRLMDVRYPIYEKAHITVESHAGPVEDILEQAIDQIYTYLNHSYAKAGI